MGFYNIILEGQQAEEYKKRKAEEEKATEDESKKNADRRAGKNGVYKHNIFKGTQNWHKYDDGSIDVHSGTRSGSKNNEHNTKSDIKDWKYGIYDQDGKIEEERVAPNLRFYNASKEDKDRDKAAQRVAKRATHPGVFPNEDKKRETDIARDAVNRHMRRHPDQWDGDKRIKTRSESGIFESVEFLND